MSTRREDKPPWSAAPPRLKAAVERVLGSRVVRGVRVYGGYGPSATYLLTMADGSRTFFKGTYPLPPGSVIQWALAREEAVYRRLGPRISPWAPHYLGSVRADGWHALLLEFVAGPGILPWTQLRASRAARSYAVFHAANLGTDMPRWLSRTQHHEFAISWRQLATDGDGLARLAALAGPRAGEARGWLRESLPPLIGAEALLRSTRRPFTLLHFDTRSDNVRLQGGLLRMFDWGSASLGPAEFDVAAFAQSIEAEGGPSADDVVGWYEQVLPLRADVTGASVAGLAGYFADRAPRPEIPELPRLRSVQRRQLVASLRWAARLLGLAPPAWLSAVPD